MKLTVIGCGDAFGSGGRFNTCFMIDTASKRLLLDCGASSLVALKAQKIDLNSIDGVMLSHLHGDHFGALPFFLLDAQFLARREKRLSIFGPPGTKARLIAAMEAFFPDSSKTKWRFPLEVGEVTPDVPGEILGLSVRTTTVIHHSGAPSTAVRLSDGQKTLIYSGDTEWTDALIPISDGADLFVCECYEYARDLTGHLSFAKLKEKRALFNVRRMMLTHMNPTMLAHADEARSAGYLIAEDGLLVDI